MQSSPSEQSSDTTDFLKKIKKVDDYMRLTNEVIKSYGKQLNEVQQDYQQVTKGNYSSGDIWEDMQSDTPDLKTREEYIEIYIKNITDGTTVTDDQLKEAITSEIQVIKQRQEKVKQRQLKVEKQYQSYKSDILNKSKLGKYVKTQDFWKLLVDRKDHKGGRLVYDKSEERGLGEKGYINAMEKAALFSALTVNDKKLDTELIENIHRYAVKGVAMQMSSSLSYRMWGKKAYVSIPLVAEGEGSNKRDNKYFSVSPEGLAELMSEETHSSFFYLGADGNYRVLKKNCTKIEAEAFLQNAIKDSKKTIMKVTEINKGEKEIKKALNKAVERYHEEISNAKTDDEKLIGIVRLLRTINNIHPFPDGNIRTVVALNIKLMIENGLAPTSMYNPNVFDGWSLDEICESIKDGMVYVAKLAPIGTSISSTPASHFKPAETPVSHEEDAGQSQKQDPGVHPK